MRDFEEALVYYQDSVAIDQLRNAHAFRRMSQQRTLHDMRMDAKTNLADWFAGKLDEYMFRYLCGDTTISHANTGTAPDSTHYIMSGDVAQGTVLATQEASLGSNDQISLADLDYAKETAKTLSPMIRPAMIDGQEYYVVVMHPYSVTDLRLDIANSAYVDWPTIQLYANKRGLDNPLFTGALGVYNGMIMFESTRIVSSSYAATANTVRRNLFLGAQAGVFAQGNAYDSLEQGRVGKDNLMSWYEETDDYGNEKGIAVGCIFGMKATRFNSKDFGKIVISSYSATNQA
jgi:N4-gp56 family major capsid protein